MSILSVLFIVAVVGSCAALQDCNSVFTSFEKFSGKCNNKWAHLKPLIKRKCSTDRSYLIFHSLISQLFGLLATQPQVGYAWIQYKISNDFRTESAAQSEIDSKPTPAVIGPGPAFYIVDDHHTLCALDYTEFDDVTVTLTVLCDKRDMSEKDFWADMVAQNFAYLGIHPVDQPNALPERISFSEIPTNFSFDSTHNSFTNDNWRALAGFSREVENVPASAVKCNVKLGDSANCQSCFFRGCTDGYQTSGLGVPFFEFRWSYYMNNGYLNSALWDVPSEFMSFISIYNAVSNNVSFELNTINTTDWLQAAGYVVPLCRSKAGREYEVSGAVFTGDLVLPGYYESYIKLPDDPSCDVPVCK